MSKKITLASALPADEVFNGLDHIAGDLDLDSRIAAFIVLEVTEIKMTKAGEVPKVRIARVEPLGPPAEIPPQRAMIVMKAGEERTGSEPLPPEATTAPEKHPDVCDHHWAYDDDDIADVPPGMERRTCLRCGHTKFLPARYDDDDDFREDQEEEEGRRQADGGADDGDEDALVPDPWASAIDPATVAIVPADEDAVVRLNDKRKR